MLITGPREKSLKDPGYHTNTPNQFQNICLVRGIDSCTCDSTHYWLKILQRINFFTFGMHSSQIIAYMENLTGKIDLWGDDSYFICNMASFLFEKECDFNSIWQILRWLPYPRRTLKDRPRHPFFVKVIRYFILFSVSEIKACLKDLWFTLFK